MQHDEQIKYTVSKILLISEVHYIMVLIQQMIYKYMSFFVYPERDDTELNVINTVIKR